MTRHEAEGPDRTPEERRADHTAIDRLADELLPALVAKLGASSLGELDVREGAWRIRLRQPVDGRATRRAGAPARGPGRADAHPIGGSHAPGSLHLPGGGPGGLRQQAVGAPTATGGTDPAGPPIRAVATSPAVGFFRPRTDLPAGARVRAGDRLGAIDVLGVPLELVAPTDGIVGATLVEPGDPVEYGQDIVEIELLASPAPGHPEAG